MRLSKMFKDAPTVNVSGLSFDSRTIKKDNVYFCLPGIKTDGHEFAGQAVNNGALVVVHSKPIENKRPGAIYLRVADVNQAMNQAAKIFYKYPAEKLLMYGVTGTNGKSTISNIIRYLQNPTKPCGYIGTIAISYGSNTLTPNLTTPDAIFLQKTLGDMVNAGMEACALEVSSHGLAQGRVDAIDFDVAIFTNFTYDHLDFHGSMENYFDAKSILFKDRVKPEGLCILNVDDGRYEDLKALCNARVITYGINQNADYRALDVHLSTEGTSFILHHGDETYPVNSNLVGEFNVYNLLAAIAAVHEEGVPLEDIIAMCNTIPPIAGRMEQIKEGQPFNVIVDFAHTPDGMEQMMKLGRAITKPGGHLIAVFGSAGQRDKPKRKVFGELADKYCDSVYLTEDDPRDEDPKEIAEEIRSGIKEINSIFLSDRYEAIRQAIEAAQAGDTVLILGKGDEPFMYMESGREPWKGDNVAARECIARWYSKKDTDPAEETKA